MLVHATTTRKLGNIRRNRASRTSQLGLHVLAAELGELRLGALIPRVNVTSSYFLHNALRD